MKSNLSINKFKYLILLLILLFSFYRSPYIFLNSRFVAEEGSHHFLFAINNSFFLNLFYYDASAGYFNLVPNVLTWFSTLVPLEYAPYFTVYGSFVIIFYLSYITLFRESELFDTDKKKILGVFLLFITPPFVSEIWINSINSQIYLCLISILILFMKNLNKKQKIENHILLFISSISGIYTCALVPLYVLKFYFNKNRYNFFNFLILIFSNLMQLGLILNSKLSNSLNNSVFMNDFNKDMMISFVYNIFLKPFFGRDLTHLIWEKISYINNNAFLWTAIFFPIFIIFAIFKFKEIIIFLKKNYTTWYLIFIFFIMSGVITFGSLENQIGGRYAVIPGVLIILILTDILLKTKKSILTVVLSIMIFTSIITGAYEFRPNYRVNLSNPDTNYLKFLDCLNCPEWKSEINKWRKDNKTLIGLWPYPKKQFSLKITKNDYGNNQ